MEGSHPGKIQQAGRLYDQYAPLLLGLCLRYCGRKEDAEDVLHEGFIKILKSIEGFRKRENGSFEGWMKRIMVNTALNFLRSRSREKMLILADTQVFPDPGPESEAECSTLPDLSREQIMELVCSLPTGYRTVFNLYVFEDYSHKEIADALGCSESTSKSQLSKARAMLRTKIEMKYSKQIAV